MAEKKTMTHDEMLALVGKIRREIRNHTESIDDYINILKLLAVLTAPNSRDIVVEVK